MSRDNAAAAMKAAPPASTPSMGLTMRASVQWAEPLAEPSQPSPVNPAPESLGDGSFAIRYEQHEQQRLLGQGGMGEVHLCRDARIGREVATKVMHPGAGSSSDAQSRFLREVRIQGQLEHPSIVPVYDLGRRPDGTPYFTMKRVRGLTLEQILAGHRRGDAALLERFAQRKLLGAFIAACQAVHFAHTRGVIHARRLRRGVRARLGPGQDPARARRTVHAWHLRQLIPGEALDAEQNAPGVKRAGIG